MSIGYESVRNAIVKQIVDVKDEIGIPLFWENRESAQLDLIESRFLTIDIDFNAGERASLERMSFNSGVVVLTHYVRVGGGVIDDLKLADTLTEALALKVIENGTISLSAMAPGTKSSKQGWRTKEWLIPFSFYA